MEIRQARREDIPQLLDMYVELMPDVKEQKLETDICERFAADENTFLMVAEEDGQLLGTVLGLFCRGLTERFLVVEDVVVLESKRRAGVGRRLLEALDAMAKERHCMYAMLVSSGFRKGAHAFYRQMGYTDDVAGFRKMYE